MGTVSAPRISHVTRDGAAYGGDGAAQEASMAETDNPWQEALEKLCPLAMRFFRLNAAETTDGTRDHESLETTLRPFLSDSQTGLKRVDKLIKVWRKHTAEGEVQEAGAQEEDYYHFEVQYRKERDFAKRMSDYNDVARVHLHNHVVSIAILGDENPRWRPHVYRWQKDGCSLTFRFQPIKLRDWRGKEEELLADDNPFSLFVLAHLLIRATRKNPKQRGEGKLRLWRRACEHKMEDQDRATLFRLIDWMLLLPTERNRPLLQQLDEMRKEKPMPFVSIFEQEILDRKKEILEQKQQLQTKDQQLRDNCLQGIALALKLKFQAEGQALFAEVQKQTDLAWLRRFLESIDPAESVEELRKLLP
jgi:hypothetical protein